MIFARCHLFIRETSYFSAELMWSSAYIRAVGTELRTSCFGECQDLLS